MLLPRRDAGDARPPALKYSADGSRFYRHPEGLSPADRRGAARAGFRTCGSAAAGRRARTISTPRPQAPKRTTRRGCRRRRRSSAKRVPEGPLAVGHAAIEHAVRLAPTSPGVYRMLNAANDVLYVGKAKNVKKRLVLLCAGRGAAAGAHPAHDRGHRDGRDRLDHDRDRGAAAGSQSDQAVAAALQRAAARRQIVSLYPDHRRPLGAADPETSRRAVAAGALFRAVRLGRRGRPHHHGAAARLPGALLHRRVLRKPHPALPALSDPALLRALHRRDRFSRLYRAGARGDGFPVRPQPRR